MKVTYGLIGFAIAIIAVLTGCEAGNTPPPVPREGQLIPFQRDFHGQQGPFPDHGYLVVQRPEIWEALWGPQQAPDVDFSQQMAVVALMGRQATAGYDIQVTEVRDTGKYTSVYVQQTTPVPGSVVAQVVTYPYHIVLVPKTIQPVYFVPVQGAPTPPITINDAFQGVNSSALLPQAVVSRDTLAWSKFWTDTFKGAVTAPTVDFAQYMAVGVLLGPKPSGGYAVTITSVDRVADRLVVNYRTTAPVPGQVVTQAPTAPYAIAIIPTSPLPVTFSNVTPPPPVVTTPTQ